MDYYSQHNALLSPMADQGHPHKSGVIAFTP